MTTDLSHELIANLHKRIKNFHPEWKYEIRQKGDGRQIVFAPEWGGDLVGYCMWITDGGNQLAMLHDAMINLYMMLYVDSKKEK